MIVTEALAKSWGFFISSPSTPIQINHCDQLAAVAGALFEV